MTLDGKKYTQELDQMQKAESVSVELCPLDALALANHVQIAAQYTGTENSKVTQIAIAAAKKIQKAVLDPESTAYEVLEAGWGTIEG